MFYSNSRDHINFFEKILLTETLFIKLIPINLSGEFILTYQTSFIL